MRLGINFCSSFSLLLSFQERQFHSSIPSVEMSMFPGFKCILSPLKSAEKGKVSIVTLFGKSELNENCVEPFFITTHLETLKCIGEHS